MKAEKINKLYTLTPSLHQSVEQALQQLDDSVPKHYHKRRSIRRVSIVFAIIALLAAFGTIAYATHLFGLVTEPVGKYGIDMHVAEDGTTASTKSNSYAKPNPTYLPKDCCQLIGNDENDNPILKAQ